MKKIIKNNKGAALAWVMITFFCAAIFILAGQSIVLRYYNNASTESQRNQAYLTARSVCDALANSIINDELMIINAINNLENQGDFFEFDDIQLDLPIEEMGETKAKIVKDRANNKTYTIIATATIGSYTDTVALKMLREEQSEGVSSGLIGAFQQNIKFENAGNVSYSKDTNSYFNGNVDLSTVSKIDAYKDLYCYPNTVLSSTNKNINVYGTLYIPSSLNLNGNTLVMKDSGNPANDAYFTGTVRVGDHPRIRQLPAILPSIPPVWAKTEGIPLEDKQPTLEPLKTYVITKDFDVSYHLAEAINNSAATAEQPIYFILDNADVYLHKSIEASNGRPKAWFILINDSELDVQDDSYIGIYASPDSEVEFMKSNDRDFNIYGEFILSEVSADTKYDNITFNYSGYAGSGETEYVEVWRKRSYEAGVW